MRTPRRIVSRIVSTASLLLGIFASSPCNLSAAPPYDYDDGRLVYGIGTTPDIRQVYYDQDGVGTSWVVDGSALSMPAGATIKHLQMRLSPRTRGALLGVQYHDASLVSAFKVLRFNGTTATWISSETNLPVLPPAGTAYLPTTAPYPRAFAIAYEQRSGDALVVGANGGADGKATNVAQQYWTWSATTQTWTGPVNMPFTSGAGRWLELYPRPGTDEIMLLLQDVSDDLHAILWHGSGWTQVAPNQPLEDKVVVGKHRPFDGAWEGLDSGRFLVVYKDTSGSDLNEPSGSIPVRYRMLDRTIDPFTQFTDEKAVTFGSGAAPEMIALAADPTSKRVAVTEVSGGTSDDAFAAMWDGDLRSTHCGNASSGALGCWVGATGSDTCGQSNCIISGALTLLDDNLDGTTPDGSFIISVGWASGRALASFIERHTTTSPNSNGLDYAEWKSTNPGTGWTGNGSTFDCPVPGSAGHEMSFVLAPFHGRNGLMLMASNERSTADDTDQQLFQAAYDGTCSDRTYSTTDRMALDGTPFDIQFNRFVQPAISLGGPLTIPAGAGARQAPDLTVTEKGRVILKDDYLLIKLPPAPLTLDWSGAVGVIAGLTYSLNGGAFSAVSAELDSPTKIDAKTVRLHVKRDLNTNDAMTIRGLFLTSYTTAKSINAATDRMTLELLPSIGSTASVLNSPPQSETVQIVESVAASNVDVKNALLKTGDITTNRELLKVTLTATGGDVTLTRLNVNVAFPGPPGTAMTWANVTRLDVYESGTAPPVATKACPSQGGAACPTDADFGSLSRLITAGVVNAKTYTLMGRFTGLLAGHEMMVSLATGPTGGVEANGATSTFVGLQTVGGITGGPVSKTHRVSTYTIGALGGLTSGKIALGQALSIPWSGVGDASTALSDVTLSYSVDNGSSWTGIGCVGGGTQNPCNWTIPTTISASRLDEAKVKIEGSMIAPDGQALPLAGSTVESTPFTVTELMTLSNPPAPSNPFEQVKNAFLDTDPNKLRDLLRFKLTAVGASVNVTQLTFNLGGSTGVASTDLSMVQILDESGTNVVSSVPVPPNSTTLVVNVNPQVSTTGQVFTLKAKVAGLIVSPPDSLSVQLDAADTSITGATGALSGRDLTGVPGTRSGGPVTKTHQVSTYRFVSLSGLTGGKIALGQTLIIDWQALGDASAALVDVVLRYSINNGTSWSAPISCANGGGTRDPCNWTIPTTISASALDQAKIKIEGKTQSDNQALPPSGSNLESSPFTITEIVTVSDPPAGPDPLQQVGNAFLDLDPSKVRDLLRFRLGATGGAVTITQLTFSLSGSNGVVVGDLSGVQVVDGSGTNIATGTPPPPNSTTLIVNVNTTIANASTPVFTLKALVANLVAPPSDVLVMTLQDGSVSVTGATGQTSGRDLTGVPGTRSGGPVAKTHTASTYVVRVPASGGMVIVGTQAWGAGAGTIIPIRWDAYGDADLGNVTVSYRYFSNSAWSSWIDLCKPGDPVLPAPTVSGTCQAIVPDTVSTNVQLRVTDTQKPVEGISGSFVIGGIIELTSVGAYDLNGAAAGGETWIAGDDYTIMWRQVGSFRTLLELSLDGGQNWTKFLGFKDVAAPVETTDSILYKVALQDVTPNAKVRARPEAAFSTMGNRESGLFAIQPAFSGIQPGGGVIFKGTDTTIRWTPLPGTGSGASPPPNGFPISSVTVTVSDQGGNPVFGPFTVGNTGSHGPWTPTAGGIAFRTKICDASHPSLNPAICVEGAAFNVVDSSVAIVAVVPPASGVNDFRLGNPATITWGGGLTGSFDLSLRQGTSTIRFITTLNADSQASHTWPIPTDLTAPLTNVYIHMERTGDSSVFANSQLFTINGQLKNVTLSSVPVKLENEARDASNDVTISWTTTGADVVKLFLKRQGDPDYLPLSSFGAAGADAVSGTSYVWTNVIGSAKTPQAFMKVAQVGSEAAVSAEYGPFSIVGELRVTQPSTPGASFDLQNPLQVPIQFEWETIRGVGLVHPVRVRVLDSNNAPIFEDPAPGNTDPQRVANLTSPQTYSWMPSTTGKNLKVEVCDRKDLTVCAVSPTTFHVSGMSVTTDRSTYTLTAGLVPVTIQWRPVNGVNGRAELAYRVGPTGTLVRIPDATTTFDSPDDLTQTFVWNVSRTFPDLSDQLQIVATDTGGSPQGASLPFAIQGVLTFTSPGPNAASPDGSYAAEDTVNIAWDTIGEISSVELAWSTDNCVTRNPIAVTQANPNANTPNGTTSVTWSIPAAAISNNLRFCLRDITTGHPPAPAMLSTPIVVGAKFTIDGSIVGKRLVSNESQLIQWTTQGDVSQVKLELVYSYDGFNTTRVKAIAGAIQNTGSYGWTITDLKGLLDSAGQPLDPQQMPEVSAKLQISDVTGPGHPTVPQRSGAFTIRYYAVSWVVVDASNNAPLTGLQVNDDVRVGWTNAPQFDLPGNVPHYYPYLQGLHTAWLLPNNNGSSDFSQGPDDTQPVQFWTSNKDQTRIVKIEVVASDAVTWNVQADYQYDPVPVPPEVEISTWLEKSGKIVDTFLEYAYAKIYLNGVLVRTLPQVAPEADAGTVNGRFKLIWDLTDDSGASLPDDKTYFATLIIRRLSRDFSTASAVNITVPKKILAGGTGGGGGGLTQAELDQSLDTKLQPIKDGVGILAVGQLPLVQAVNEIHAETVGANSKLKEIHDATAAPGSTLEKIATEIVGPDSKLAKIHGATVGPDSTLEKVQAYLADETKGLPRVLSNQTDIQKELKGQRGGLLNRDMELEQGESAVIQYRSGGGVPSLSVYDGAGAPVSVPPLLLNSTTGLYESTFDTASLNLGEYRVIVNEPASTDSAGTLDSVALRVREPITTASQITAVTAKFDAIDARLIRVDSLLTTYEIAMQNINELGLATQGRAQQLVDDLQNLMSRWPTLTEVELRDELTTLENRLGDPGVGQSLTTALEGLKQTMGALPAGETVATRLDELRTMVDQIPTTTGGSVDLSGLEAQLDLIERLLNDVQGGGAPIDLGPLASQLTTVQQLVEAQSPSETGALLAKLKEIQGAVESAQGSSAAVGLAQSAYIAASEAVKILQQLQTELRTQGAGAPNAPILLNQLNDKLTNVSQSVTVIPGKFTGEELSEQLKQLAEQAKGIASEKGYRFDALYEISESQSGDVKTMRNQVEEMKALLEVQRMILERNVNQPIIKAWFEGG